jgi:L-phenylalanine/L-methionine N-acetyltransferase
VAKRARQPKLLIRALEPTDAEAMARLHAMPGYRYGTLRPPYPTVASVRKFLEDSGPDNFLIGAFIGDRLVGTAGMHRSGGRRRHAADLGMGVADDVAGRGIGTALLRELLDAADKWFDVRRLELTVFHDNQRAIRLYERNGFEREGLLRAYAFRDGSYVDVIAMARLKGL